MLQFNMVQNVKAIIGAGSVDQLGELLKEMGNKKPLFVCDEGVFKAGIVDKAAKSVAGVGLEYAVYSNVQPDPPVWTTGEGIEFFNKNGCDSVVAIGGGSSIDTAKAINLLRFNDGPILKYASPDAVINASGGLICIPTTAGTGSELSDGIVLSEGTTKYPILAPNCMSECVILDPELMVGLPRHVTASTGMDALAHAAEAYISNISNSFTDAISEKVIEIAAKWLPVACDEPGNLKAREEMCLAATLGGWMLVQAHSVCGHSLAHALGGHFHIPHGFACAYTLPVTLEYNVEYLPEKVKWIGEVFGVKFTGAESNAEIGALTKAAVARFRDEVLGMRPAKDFNPDLSKIDAAVESTLNDVFQLFNPRKMTAPEAKEILLAIFA